MRKSILPWNCKGLKEKKRDTFCNKKKLKAEFATAHVGQALRTECIPANQWLLLFSTAVIAVYRFDGISFTCHLLFFPLFDHDQKSNNTNRCLIGQSRLSPKIRRETTPAHEKHELSLRHLLGFTLQGDYQVINEKCLLFISNTLQRG